MCCHFLLHATFPTQGSNLGLLHCRRILYHLSHQGSLLNVEPQAEILRSLFPDKGYPFSYVIFTGERHSKGNLFKPKLDCRAFTKWRMAYYFPAWTPEWYFVSCGYRRDSHKSVLQSGGLQNRSRKWCRKLPTIFRWSNTCIPAHLSALDFVMGATCRWEISEGTKVYNAVERKK